MTPHPELYVLRHGETEWNAQGRLQGKFNSPLNALGRRQAARQAEILAGIDLAGFKIFSSPQGRVIETAAIALARQVGEIHTDSRLREIGMGDWAGMLKSDLEAQGLINAGAGESLDFYEDAPHGEGFAALEARCAAFLASLTGPAVLVTHSITSRMIRAIVTGKGRAGVANVGCGQGVIYHLLNSVQKRLD